MAEPSERLVGREGELEIITGTWGGDHPGALLIRGAAGVGKTRLLEEVARSLPERALLRLEASPSEDSMPYSGLHRLLAPRLTELHQIPATRRRALQGALGLRALEADRLQVGLAVLDLLAVSGPVLCLVDDADLLDVRSAEALAVAARHLWAQPVTLVLTAGTPAHGEVFDALAQVELSALAEHDARALLSDALHVPLDDRVREQILAEARGNPRALLEIPHRTEPTDLAGGYGLPAAVSVPEQVVTRVRCLLDDLPAPARQLALIAASDPVGDPVVLWRAAAALGLDSSALRPAIESGLLDTGLRLLFESPLTRCAVYHAATARQRRRAHATLAEVTAGDGDPARSAWHRAVGSSGPDEDLVGALRAAVGAARDRGGTPAAAAFLRRAAALSGDHTRRVELAFSAAEATREAGDLDEASRLIAVAELGARGETPHAEAARARAVALRARIAFDRTHGGAQARALLDAANRLAGVDPAQADEASLRALVGSLTAGPLSHDVLAREVAELVRSAPTVPRAEPGPIELTLRALTTALIDGRPAAVPAAREAVAALLRADPSARGRDLVWVWLVCSLAWDDTTWPALAERHVSALRRAGELAELPHALNYRALAHVHAGEFTAAEAVATEARRVRAVLGAGESHYVELLLAAWRGDRELVDGLARRSEAQADRQGEGRMLASAVYARLVLDNGSGRHGATAEPVDSSAHGDALGYHVFIPPELVEMAAHAGRLDLAREALDQVAEHARAADTPWALGIERRCRALIADDAHTEDLFRESVEHLARSAAAPHRARTQLLYGEWLRRHQRRTDARAQLRAAFETLDGVGARQFALRAARELRAAGETPRSSARGPQQLTSQELEIARLVADGQTSRSVAGALLISPRTVDAHLRNIFVKLGVSSRHEIREALRGGAAGSSPDPRSGLERV